MPVPQSPPAPRYRTENWRANARALGKGDHKKGSSNYTMLQGFEWYTPGGGVYYKDMESKAKELGEMGITAVWMPPPTKCDTPDSVGYSPYDLWDLGEFEQKGGKATKWGTKDEFLSCIKALKDNGIVVYIDAVLNHKMGADRAEKFHATKVDEHDRNKEISDLYEIEGWTGFDFDARMKTERGRKLSEMKWSHIHFTGVDYDNKTQENGIFKIQGEGKTWAKAVDKEEGNYDYLMGSDIDHSHPAVREDLINWGVWIMKETGAAGFRFDAIKHIDEGFVAEFVKQVRERLDNEDLFCVGEFWKMALPALESYLDKFPEQMSLFDACLHNNFHSAGEQGPSFDLRQIFDGTLLQSRPVDAVTLVCNHDTQPTQALEAPVATWFAPLAYSLITLRGDGYPCIFAGDLWGCKSEPPVDPIAQLGDIVKARKWFAYGETRDYWDHANCVGWVREGDDEHDGCAVVVCNGTAPGEKRMQLEGGDKHKGEVWVDLLGWFQGEVTIEDDGWATFGCPEQSVSIWTKKDARGKEAFAK
ncbi:glycoside hydrolase family 13 protein [Rhodotorula graminis WP1]|uniref:Glycoside hydrolase family 13 protein n=1 Tax=Rhodotorula graminis (strain WP1) TaxID=578459 RepID=A0A0P9EQH2_RHOGW|nr:glycoside hydrolase family 13 protein [Rhodotorula graminis WP1]KPV71753.1 glycoside hydrolase family 13 protein [Rhodotorula graminis WP1]